MKFRPKFRVKFFSKSCMYRFTVLGSTENCIWYSTEDATYQLYPKNIHAYIILFLVYMMDYHIEKRKP